MPGGDRTGPLGLGPRTGRAAGYCSGYPAPGYANNRFGRGYGFGFGFGRGRGFGRGLGMGYGRGWRHRNFAYGAYDIDYPYDPDYRDYPEAQARSADITKDELRYLRREARDLNKTLDDINARIKDLEEKKEA
ncbi:MAG TPA: hypothetical protein ENO22_01020 [candidate division Zixibacteria bacterium]|nr:hypothetical protein [candidate division Zixibacteria bacterium]HEQ97904.1 hypothetical protein [candidate division Zixibacteria bacterium]